MQKISSYIYPNKISVVGNEAGLITEWRIVYQRVIKIYRGIDNVLEFDIKNGQQRRMDVSALTMRCVIMDQNGEELYTGPLVPLQTKGLVTFTIPSMELDNITTQFLKYSLYIIDPTGIRLPIYGDVDYGMIGQMELITSAFPAALPPQIIDTFRYLYDHDSTEWIKTYYSEAVEINAPNDFVTSPTMNLEFRSTKLDAELWVQVTDYAVISAATPWYDIEYFNIANTTTHVYKSYTDITNYSNNIGWMRIKYIPKGFNTGTLDKVIVRL
jgi:hypothetical protein